MTLEQTNEHQSPSTQDPVSSDRVQRILRTGRVESTGQPQPRRNRVAIGTNEPQTQVPHAHHLYLYRPRPKDIGSPQRRAPCDGQLVKRPCQRLALWKNKDRLPWNEITMTLSDQLPKHALGSISPNRVSEPATDDNPYASRPILRRINQHVEQFRRNSSAMALDRFDLSTHPQENAPRPFHRQLGSHRESTVRRCPTPTWGNSSRQAREEDTLARRPNMVGKRARTGVLRPAHHTVNRARPLARRRARTRRPFFVLMRFRKPCSRFFLRFDGCRNVNDTRPPFDCLSIKKLRWCVEKWKVAL